MAGSKGARLEGGCQCGRVRYASDADPINIRACHCRTCQKVTGGPFYARVLVPLGSLTVTGKVGWHATSANLRRGFCPTCGSSLFSERASQGVVGLMTATLDQPADYPPAAHIWVSEKLPGVAIPGGVAQYAKGAPA